VTLSSSRATVFFVVIAAVRGHDVDPTRRPYIESTPSLNICIYLHAQFIDGRETYANHRPGLIPSLG